MSSQRRPGINDHRRRIFTPQRISRTDHSFPSENQPPLDHRRAIRYRHVCARSQDVAVAAKPADGKVSNASTPRP